jgi:hypothetical protein
VDFRQAENVILGWQAQKAPMATIVQLDQPTFVSNAAKRQRPVENLVASPKYRAPADARVINRLTNSERKK